MKSFFPALLSGILFAFLLTACDSPAAENKSPEKPDAHHSEAPEEKVVEEVKEVKVNYAEDWAAFKTAMADRNVDQVNAFIKMEGVQAEDLFPMISKEVIADMNATGFDQLEETEHNETAVKEYSYEESAVDEEGHEIGMALFFYFQEQAEGLRLVDFLAAG